MEKGTVSTKKRLLFKSFGNPYILHPQDITVTNITYRTEKSQHMRQLILEKVEAEGHTNQKNISHKFILT